MSAKKHVAVLGGLDGVIEASLLTLDGSVVESSADSPALPSAAVRLGSALSALKSAIPDLGEPVSLTIEGERGALHLSRVGESLLVLSTTPDANLGAVRLELREAVRDLSTQRQA
jgi:predicted regulator of Ras-like GTPase activity (Roadblock/LC7/MglB family)